MRDNLSYQKRTLDLIMNRVRGLITLNLVTEVSEPLGEHGLQFTNKSYLNEFCGLNSVFISVLTRSNLKARYNND